MRSLLVVEAMVEAISTPIDSAHCTCNRAMSEKGDCWDNAVAESFFSTLEWELLRKRSFATHPQARRIVSEYIDQFFNPIRRHSTNGYFSPIEFELRWQSRQLTV